MCSLLQNKIAVFDITGRDIAHFAQFAKIYRYIHTNPNNN